MFENEITMWNEIYEMRMLSELLADELVIYNLHHLGETVHDSDRKHIFGLKNHKLSAEFMERSWWSGFSALIWLQFEIFS